MDPAHIARVADVHVQEKKLNAYLTNVKEWIESMADIIESHINMSNALQVLYENSEYCMQVNQVQYEVVKLDAKVKKIQKLKGSLVEVTQRVFTKIKELDTTIEKYEEVRLQYDHYRNKLNKLQKEGYNQANDDAKQEKFARTQIKFDQTKYEFDNLNTDFKDLLDKAEDRCERVLIDLTLKFSKQMQLNLFNEVNQVFNKLKHIEQEMVQIAFSEEQNVMDAEKRETRKQKEEEMDRNRW